MAFVLRWLAILALLALVLLCAIGALGAAGVITGYDVPASGVAQVDTQIAAAQSAADRNAASAGWIDVGLLGAATLFFLISAIRLMRRTQGFWTWLLGFACYGGRWAWAQQQDGNALATLQSINVNAYMQPQALLNNLGSTEAQVALLAIMLVLCLFVLIVDAADRTHWDKQAA